MSNPMSPVLFLTIFFRREQITPYKNRSEFYEVGKKLTRKLIEKIGPKSEFEDRISPFHH